MKLGYEICLYLSDSNLREISEETNQISGTKTNPGALLEMTTIPHPWIMNTAPAILGDPFPESSLGQMGEIIYIIILPICPKLDSRNGSPRLAMVRLSECLGPKPPVFCGAETWVQIPQLWHHDKAEAYAMKRVPPLPMRSLASARQVSISLTRSFRSLQGAAIHSYKTGTSNT